MRDLKERSHFCILQEEPYLIEVKGAGNLKGKDRYAGFCVELLKSLARTENFTYEIRPVRDGKYGAVNSSEVPSQLITNGFSRFCWLCSGTNPVVSAFLALFDVHKHR